MDGAEGACAAFGTRFEDEGCAEVAFWRYHPETVSAGSVRAVVFARTVSDRSGSVGEILRVTPGVRGGSSEWVVRVIEAGEIERWLRDADGRLVGIDVYGFRHRLEEPAACGCCLQGGAREGAE